MGIFGMLEELQSLGLWAIGAVPIRVRTQISLPIPPVKLFCAGEDISRTYLKIASRLRASMLSDSD